MNVIAYGEAYRASMTIPDGSTIHPGYNGQEAKVKQQVNCQGRGIPFYY